MYVVVLLLELNLNMKTGVGVVLSNVYNNYDHRSPIDNHNRFVFNQTIFLSQQYINNFNIMKSKIVV